MRAGRVRDGGDQSDILVERERLKRAGTLIAVRESSPQSGVDFLRQQSAFRCCAGERYSACSSHLASDGMHPTIIFIGVAQLGANKLRVAAA